MYDANIVSWRLGCWTAAVGVFSFGSSSNCPSPCDVQTAAMSRYRRRLLQTTLNLQLLLLKGNLHIDQNLWCVQVLKSVGRNIKSQKLKLIRFWSKWKRYWLLFNHVTLCQSHDPYLTSWKRSPECTAAVDYGILRTRYDGGGAWNRDTSIASDSGVAALRRFLQAATFYFL